MQGLNEAVPLHHLAAGDQLCLWGSISAVPHPSAFGVKCLKVKEFTEKGKQEFLIVSLGSRSQGSLLHLLLINS